MCHGPTAPRAHLSLPSHFLVYSSWMTCLPSPRLPWSLACSRCRQSLSGLGMTGLERARLRRGAAREESHVSFFTGDRPLRARGDWFFDDEPSLPRESDPLPVPCGERFPDHFRAGMPSCQLGVSHGSVASSCSGCERIHREVGLEFLLHRCLEKDACKSMEHKILDPC